MSQFFWDNGKWDQSEWAGSPPPEETWGTDWAWWYQVGTAGAGYQPQPAVGRGPLDDRQSHRRRRHLPGRPSARHPHRPVLGSRPPARQPRQDGRGVGDVQADRRLLVLVLRFVHPGPVRPRRPPGRRLRVHRHLVAGPPDQRRRRNQFRVADDSGPVRGDSGRPERGERFDPDLAGRDRGYRRPEPDHIGQPHRYQHRDNAVPRLPGRGPRRRHRRDRLAGRHRGAARRRGPGARTTPAGRPPTPVPSTARRWWPARP